MPLSLNGGNIAAQAVQAAHDAADAAMAAAQNARQMVLNRDPAAAAVASDVTALKTNQPDVAAMNAQIDSLLTQIATLTTSVNAMPIVRTGTSLVVAALLGGASRDVVVTLTSPMPTATYSAGAWINGGTSLLGQTQLVGITAQDKNSVTVQVKNTGLTSIAASALTVQVLAVK